MTSRRGRKRGGASALDSRGARRRLLKRKKFTEPVALSSPEPVGFPLARTAPRPGFDLLALRARCKGDTTPSARRVQGVGRGKDALCTFSFLTHADERFLLHALKGSDQKNSPSRLRFRPPNRLTFRFRVRPPDSASTYSRSVLGAGENLDRTDMALQGPGGEKSPQFASG